MLLINLLLIPGITLAIFCIFLLLLTVNLLTFYRLHSSTQCAPRIRPMVSILVPARDEERAIAACVRSLVEQEYEPLEVLVLDDQSSDATATIVQQLIDALPPGQQGRLRLLHGAPLPAGWVGKNFACQQLAGQAQGEYLLFTDADTIHAPGMARAMIDCMQDLGVKLLTGQPEQELGGLGERLIIPLLNFKIMTLLPVNLIRQRPEPSLALGNGQLLCFHRSAYEVIGGHSAVKGRILEDVLLARAVKAAGMRIAFIDACEMVRCRMYHSFGEVWKGFSKNLFALYNYALPFALLAIVLNLGLFVVPPLLALATPFIALPLPLLLWALITYTLAVLMRILLTLRFTHRRRGLQLLLCPLHPVSILLECLILLNSIRWHYRKGGTEWKGRRYTR